MFEHDHLVIPLPTDPALITAIFAGVGAVIVAVARGVAMLKRSMVEANEPLMHGQMLARNRAVRQDAAIEDIHGLVNSRLMVVTQLLVSALRREALRTDDRSDIEAYEKAVSELKSLEESARAFTARQLERQEAQRLEAEKVAHEATMTPVATVSTVTTVTTEEK